MASRLAKIVSYVFEGSVLAVPTFIMICFYRQEDPERSFINLIVSIVFAVMIPYFFVLYLYKSGRIKDLHLPRRKDRILPVCTSIACFIAAYFIIDLLGAITLLKDVFLIYIVALIFFGIITLFWKISFHTSYITLFCLICILIFGKIAFFTVVLIFLVSWARIRLKRHTLAQVLAGIGLNLAITILILYYRGYLGYFDYKTELITVIDIMGSYSANIYLTIGLLLLFILYRKSNIIFSSSSLNGYGNIF